MTDTPIILYLEVNVQTDQERSQKAHFDSERHMYTKLRSSWHLEGCSRNLEEKIEKKRIIRNHRED